MSAAEGTTDVRTPRSPDCHSPTSARAGTVREVDGEDRAVPEGPPADAEDWTEDQWLAWLKATDEPRAPCDQRPVTSFGRLTHTTGGTLLGQAMLAVGQAVFGKQDDEVVIVSEGQSEPTGDEPFAVHLDHEHPERSTAVFREDPSTE
jgi:hypothetical protein